ncbi:MAG: hypothetical protein HQ568_00390 [Calditrichaeota bacterium]|nr:hypothetical protein [Calditrichota bacterium]
MNHQKNVIRLTAAILFTYITLTSFGYAAERGGQTGAFTRLGLGADRVAMGDCGVALTGGSNNWFYNSAALVLLDDRTASFGYRCMSLDRKIMYAGFAMPVEPEAGLAFGIIRAGVDDIDVRDSAGNHIYMMDQSDNLLYGSFALTPKPGFALGISIKWLINNVPDVLDDDKNVYGTGISIDLGLQLALMQNLRLGFQARNLIGRFTWDTSKLWKDDLGTKEDELPKSIYFGTAYDLIEDLTVTSDIVVYTGDSGSESESSEVHLGAEYRYELSDQYRFSLRGGWNGKTPTFGFGLKMNLQDVMARMDYAFYIEDIAPGSAHLIGWVFEF